MTVIELTDNLKKSLDALNKINEVIILQKWKWSTELEKWFIQIRIASDIEGEIPEPSLWYVVVGHEYPKGDVKIYPSIDSFELTFEHQSNNGEKEKLWRKGSPCLTSQLKCLGRYDSTSDPIHVDKRLWWNVKRLIDWIRAVNTDTLVKDGEPFELPQFNDKLPYCVFSEDDDTFKKWKTLKYKYGIVELDLFKSEVLPYYIIKDFKTPEGVTIHHVNWGDDLSKRFNNPLTAIWIMLDEIPVVNRWQAPNLLKDLINTCGEQKHEGSVNNINLLNIIQRITKENSIIMRDGSRHLLLLGFPIPEKIGGENSSIHWQAIKLPILSELEVTGFRNPEDILWKKDEVHVFTPNRKLDWLKSQNWSLQKITNRGQLPKNIRLMRTAIIGAGTIGASIAELLVRSGVTGITIIDNDRLEIGNLTRHTLKFDEIEKYKSIELANHLNKINPHVKAQSINKEFNYSDEFIDKIDKCDLIIDCTSENVVLDELEKFIFKKEKIFVSVSIGIGAEMLYLFMQKCKQFKVVDFYKKISFWLERDIKKFPEYDLPRDGVNCWNPIFPARYDDILLASSTAVKVIENFIVENKKELNSVYKQYSKNEILIGYTKIE